ncbi:MAG: Cys-tRNA(Pro) deacylase [Spirochaetia bacterium]|nr:Cys-tRNA(Pro) deacylase [Spirochaetia bacterium]
MSDKKTNAMRILDGLGIKYSVTGYDVDPDNLDALSAAAKLGVSPECIFKTIVMRNEKNLIFVFCVSAESEVNLKKARTVSGSKEIKPVKMTELLALTGYIRGGCSPVGMKKKFPLFIDETATLFDEIYISAGVRGRQLILSPDDLVKATDGTFADVATTVAT